MLFITAASRCTAYLVGNLHDPGRRSPGQQFVTHEIHIGCHMFEKPEISVTEIIQPRLSR